MNNQTRQSYDIDNRRAGTYASAMGESWAASDNEGGNQFLQEYLAKKRVDENPNLFLRAQILACNEQLEQSRTQV